MPLNETKPIKENQCKIVMLSFKKGKEKDVSLTLIDQPKNWDLTLSFILNDIC